MGGSTSIYSGGVNVPIYSGNTGAPLPRASPTAVPSVNPMRQAGTPVATPVPTPAVKSGNSSFALNISLNGHATKVNFTRTLVARPNKSSPTGWTTTITLTMSNNGEARLEDFMLRERIPDAIARDPSELAFSVKPDYFQKGSVIAVWSFGYLNPGDSLSVGYSVDRFLPPSYLAMFRDPVLSSARVNPAPSTLPAELSEATSSPTAGSATGLFTASTSPITMGAVALVILAVLGFVFTRARKPPVVPPSA